MNYVPQIISYLSAKEGVVELYLSPRNFIMERVGGKLVRFSEHILSPEDIRDTLIALRSHAPSTMGPLGREGYFSFSLYNVGRVRVSYITQRGSYVVYILKTPHHIPNIEDLCDKACVEQLDELLRQHTSGMVIFCGGDYIKTNTLLYSMMQYTANNYSKVILVLEKPLSFLLKHGNSIVIQREVGTDVDSFEDGLREAFYINPQMVFVGFKDEVPANDLERLLRILCSSSLVLVHLPVADTSSAISTAYTLKDSVKALVEVHSSPSGMPQVSIKHIQPQEWESR